MPGYCPDCGGHFERLGGHTACPRREIKKQLALKELEYKYKLEQSKNYAQYNTEKKVRLVQDNKRTINYVTSYLVVEDNRDVYEVAKCIVHSDEAYKEFLIQHDKLKKVYTKVLPYKTSNGTQIMIIDKLFPTMK